MKITRLFFIFVFCVMVSIPFVNAQSVETYAGSKRAGLDLMWFRNFKDIKQQKTPFLFFSRNRVSTDYHNAAVVFASTNAVSYNFKNGLGAVLVASYLGNGLTPKAGVQLFRQKNNWMFFGWLVTDVKNKGNVDCFGLFRYLAPLKNNWKLFNQAELFPVYTPFNKNWNLTQRLRIGLKYNQCSFGVMADFSQTGQQHLATTENIGGFVRCDF